MDLEKRSFFPQGIRQWRNWRYILNETLKTGLPLGKRNEYGKIIKATTEHVPKEPKFFISKCTNIEGAMNETLIIM